MKLARDGLPTVFTTMALTAAAGYLCPIASVPFALLFLMSLWFYRDPERTPEGGPDDWVSPADGTVVELIPDAEDEFAGRAFKIGIFMNGFDVHVNRCPTEATVAMTKYVPGKKWFASAPKASLDNERFYVGIDTAKGRSTLVQIAGIMARRIARRAKIGDRLARGERYGMIKLGSKVDIYLPSGMEPAVSMGQKVKAGRSVIARPTAGGAD